MKKTRIIEIEISTTSKSDMGIDFMYKAIKMTINILDQYRKCYSARIIRMENK